MRDSASRLRHGALPAVLASILAGTISITVGPQPVTAQAGLSLRFERPAAQGPGTSGFGIASDPTVRPFQAPGFPATIGTTLPIDFQGNGRPDLLACHGTSTTLPDVKLPCRVLRPQPDGSVTEITRQMFGTGALPSASGPKQIVPGDFNEDGRLDVFIAAEGYDAPPFSGETNVLLTSNADGTYTDRSSTLPQTPDFTHSACVADVNGDGHLDIYVGNVHGQLIVGPYFLIGKGDGTFTQKTSGLPLQIQNLQERFMSCLLVDVDRDGYADLVLGTHGAGGFVDNIVLFNDGTGDFTRRPRYVLPPWPQPVTLDIVALDINRDGWPDLVLVTTNTFAGPAHGWGVQLLINQGNATFADETLTRLGTSSLVADGSLCGFVRLADFNGDGWKDFYCNNGPENVPNRYWISNGDGTWNALAPGILPAGSGLGIHAVDFDGDLHPDLLSISPTSTGDIRYQSFLNRTPFFNDDPLISQVSVIKAIHFEELRQRIDAQRTRFGLTAFGWTDPALAGRIADTVHLKELRTALNAAYAAAIAAGRKVAQPSFADDPPVEGQTPIRLQHLQELRTAVLTLEAA